MSQTIAIVGAGPTGMALALALARQGQRAALFDARPRGAALEDGRILALADGSRQILKHLGVWEQIDSTPITAIHVSQQGGFGRTRMRAEEQGLAALGYVASAASISAALNAAVERAGIPVHDNTRLLAVEAETSEIRLQLSDGCSRSARLLAYAEGAVNAEADIVERNYEQFAISFTLSTASVPEGTAFERFTPDGPLALLPHGMGYAAVLTCSADKCEALVALDDAEFIAHIQAQLASRGDKPPHFSALGQRLAYPLALRFRKTPIAARQVWLGNAAQTLHPVAGQGFNLALRDCFELARLLKDSLDPGAELLLQRHAKARRADRFGSIALTHSLVNVFSNDFAPLRHVRGAALCALDLLPPLRNFLARRLMYGARNW